EKSDTGASGDVCAARVVNVVIDRIGRHAAAIAEDAVFAVQGDVAAPDVVGDQRRNTQTEVDVAGFGQQGRGVLGHLGGGPAGLAVVGARHVGGPSETAEAAPVGLDRPLHDATDKAAGQANAVWVDCARLDDLVDLDDCDAGAFGEAGVEVLTAAAKLAVTEPIGAVRGHERVVDANGRLEQERLAVEDADLFAFGDGC